MPAVAKSTSVPFKVLYLPSYRSVSAKLEMGETVQNWLCEEPELQNILKKCTYSKLYMASNNGKLNHFQYIR